MALCKICLGHKTLILKTKTYKYFLKSRNILTLLYKKQKKVHTSHLVSFLLICDLVRPFDELIMDMQEKACPQTTAQSFCGVILVNSVLLVNRFHSISNLGPENDRLEPEPITFVHYATYSPNHNHLYSRNHLKQETLCGMSTWILNHVVNSTIDSKNRYLKELYQILERKSFFNASKLLDGRLELSSVFKD